MNMTKWITGVTNSFITYSEMLLCGFYLGGYGCNNVSFLCVCMCVFIFTFVSKEYNNLTLSIYRSLVEGLTKSLPFVNDMWSVLA